MAYLDDYSMSVRAFEAYQNGEKPLSRWKKDDILEELREKHDMPFLAAALAARRFTLAFLKDTFLEQKSWHHTSCKYNRTDFYAVSPALDESEYIEKLDSMSARFHELEKELNPAKEKNISAWRKGRLVWRTWEKRCGGWGKWVQKQAEGYIRQENDWLCCYDSRGKKRKLITKRNINSNAQPTYQK